MMNLDKIKMIKKYSVWVVLLVLFSRAEQIVAQNFRVPGTSNQQNLRNNFNNIDNSNGMHKIDKIKTDFLSDNMHLTADEAEKFWPVYNQYQRELNPILHQKRQNMLNPQKSPQDVVKDNFDYDSKILSIKKHYNDEFSRVLPQDKLAQFYKSERMFNEEMINRLKSRRDNND
jgi:signal peptidase I